MTRNYTLIINFAKQNDNRITTKEAVELLGKYYYANEGYYVGMSLNAMVKSGILKRIERGKYALLQAPLSNPQPMDKNQIKLF